MREDQDEPPTTTTATTILSNELERYKNRALLTELLLKEKVSQLDVLQSKLYILQNVTLKLASQTQNLTRSFENETITRQQTQAELERIMENFAKTTQSLETELKLIQRDKETAVTKVKQTSDATIQALRSEVIDLDQTLEETHSKLLKLEKQTNRDRQDFELTERTLRQQIARLQQDVQIAREDSSAKQEFDEQIQIAVASVKAAEKREQTLCEDMAKLQARYERLLQENKQLKDLEEVHNSEQLAREDNNQLEQEVYKLKEQIQSMKTKHAKEMDAFKKIAQAKNDLQQASIWQKEQALVEQRDRAGSKKQSLWRRVARRVSRIGRK